ncbi:hypothetical protein NMG46_20610 [Mesorhizobium sp. LMG 17147]|uniref:hypothetical protein n=1 Tax=Mesorhizobium sp. LMG 17147 TaxID=2963091 RepID=UPI0020C9F861|nr:hypothetical protein [Mesorhizobium sp. LMG 17147]MCP9232635.1 hypothetical protein [Mesorhizobium sp. LMG 17147]
MSESIYDDLPEDHEEAFIYLERKFRSQLDTSLRDNDQSNYDAYCKRKYMSAVIAAAKSLDIPGIKEYTSPYNDKGVWDAFEGFETDVMNLTIQIEINHARRRKKYSVGLSGGAKQKIRHYIEQIRTAVEESNLPQDKRDVIFKKLSELTLEVDRDRTRFEIVADVVRGVARVSGDVEREGAEPWWRWVRLIFGEIDDAKEKEPQTSLPKPEERKRLEPPRKQLPSPNDETFRRELDDEIPF